MTRRLRAAGLVAECENDLRPGRVPPRRLKGCGELPCLVEHRFRWSQPAVGDELDDAVRLLGSLRAALVPGIDAEPSGRA